MLFIHCLYIIQTTKKYREKDVCCWSIRWIFFCCTWNHLMALETSNNFSVRRYPSNQKCTRDKRARASHSLIRLQITFLTKACFYVFFFMKSNFFYSSEILVLARSNFWKFLMLRSKNYFHFSRFLCHILTLKSFVATRKQMERMESNEKGNDIG